MGAAQCAPSVSDSDVVVEAVDNVMEPLPGTSEKPVGSTSSTPSVQENGHEVSLMSGDTSSMLSEPTNGRQVSPMSATSEKPMRGNSLTMLSVLTVGREVSRAPSVMEMRRQESRRHFVNRHRVVQHPSANLFTENTTGLLDRSFDEVAPLLWYKCDTCRPSGPYTDNDRMLMAWQMSDGSSPKTPRLALQQHKGQAICFFCQTCGNKCHEIRLVDTFEKLFRDLRGIVTNDPALPLIYNPTVVDADIPGDAGYCCELAHRFKVESHLTDEMLSRIAVSLSAGALRKRLEKKMEGGEREHGSKYRSYIRIGVGLKALGPITAVLEMWPRGHSSPKHEHGGCAGCVRVIFGKLHMKLYRTLDSGDDPIEIPGVTQAGGVIVMEAPVTTWMNRENWYIHEVSSPDDNDRGFALSVHVYRASTDEFAFAHEDHIEKSNPSNDFFWNIDLPSDDPRVSGILDFATCLHGPDEGRQVAEAWCTEAERSEDLPMRRWSYLKALECDSTCGLAWLGLGSIGGCDHIAGLNDIKDGAYSSKSCFQMALECDSGLITAWIYLGLEGGGTVSNVAYKPYECFAQALKLDKTSAIAWTHLGYVGGAKEGVIDAGKTNYSPKKCFEEALQIDPQLGLAWRGLGSVGGGMVKGVHQDEQACRQEMQQCKAQVDAGVRARVKQDDRSNAPLLQKLALLMKRGGVSPKV